MSEKRKYFVFASLLVFGLYLFSPLSSLAATNAERNHRLVTQKLAQKLKADLSNEAAIVKLKKVEQYKISRSEIGLTGDAVCITGETQLPLKFEVKINSPKQIISEISYNFVEEVAANYAPSSEEEFLMKELMSKISRDYKTTNIVIAIDNYENVGVVDNEKKLLGVGEVRIGDMVWNTIKFDVSLDAGTNKARKVSYKVE